MQASDKLRAWLYKWLPIFMGCHCRPDRSFHIRGRQFPICARCTGMLGGFLAAAVLIAWNTPPLAALFLLLLPMLLDGGIQRFTRYESNNRRRLITGLLGGYASMTLLLLSFVYTFRLGQHLAQLVRAA